jgi:hypothetical protein
MHGEARGEGTNSARLYLQPGLKFINDCGRMAMHGWSSLLSQKYSCQ